MQISSLDEKQSQELFDKGLKYARLYARDCDDLTAQELADAVFEHLTKNKSEYLPRIDNVVKGVVNLVFRKKDVSSEVATLDATQEKTPVEIRPRPVIKKPFVTNKPRNLPVATDAVQEFEESAPESSDRKIIGSFTSKKRRR